MRAGGNINPRLRGIMHSSSAVSKNVLLKLWVHRKPPMNCIYATLCKDQLILPAHYFTTQYQFPTSFFSIRPEIDIFAIDHSYPFAHFFLNNPEVMLIFRRNK